MANLRPQHLLKAESVYCPPLRLLTAWSPDTFSRPNPNIEEGRRRCLREGEEEEEEEEEVIGSVSQAESCFFFEKEEEELKSIKAPPLFILPISHFLFREKVDRGREGSSSLAHRLNERASVPTSVSHAAGGEKIELIQHSAGGG